MNNYSEFTNSDLNTLLEDISPSKYGNHEELIREILARLIKLGGLKTDGDI